MKEIKLDVPGFEGRDFKAIDKGIFGGLEIHLDGKKISRTKFKYLVTDNQGQEVEIKLNNEFLIDIGASLTIKDKVIYIKQPLKWYEYVFGAWPLLMIFIGGAIGGGLGAIATSININIFRSKLNVYLKYITTLMISIVSIVLWLVIAVILQGTFGRR